MSKLAKFGNDVYDKAAERLRSVDFFGQPIELTYKGKRAYHSPFGGIMTIIMVSVFTVYALTSLFSLLGF